MTTAEGECGRTWELTVKRIEAAIGPGLIVGDDATIMDKETGEEVGNVTFTDGNTKWYAQYELK